MTSAEALQRIKSGDCPTQPFVETPDKFRGHNFEYLFTFGDGETINVRSISDMVKRREVRLERVGPTRRAVFVPKEDE